VSRRRTPSVRECIHVKNQDVAARLREIADFLEIQEVEYKPRA
jgi:hypothetical protein